MIFVGGQVIEDDDGSGQQRGGELGLDVNVESCPIHCPPDHPRRDQSIAGEPGDEGLRLPAAERRHTEEPVTDGAPPMQAGHVCLHGRLVDKDQTLRSFPHERLAAHGPIMSRQPDIRPFALLCNQTFFYMRTRLGPVPGGSKTDAPTRHVFLPALQPVPSA